MKIKVKVTFYIQKTNNTNTQTFGGDNPYRDALEFAAVHALIVKGIEETIG